MSVLSKSVCWWPVCPNVPYRVRVKRLSREKRSTHTYIRSLEYREEGPAGGREYRNLGKSVVCQRSYKISMLENSSKSYWKLSERRGTQNGKDRSSCRISRLRISLV